jgi:signal transduction histidine kinase
MSFWREIVTRCAISLILFFIGAFALFTVLRRLSQKIETEVEEVVGVAHARGNNSGFSSNRFEIKEFGELSNQFGAVFTALRESAKIAALEEVASQVRHDIQSPVAALETLAETTPYLKEDDRILLRGAVSRIRDIFFTLSTESPATGIYPRTPRFPSIAPSKACEEETPLLSSLIDEISNEKRLQYRGRSAEVEIQSDLGDAAYGLFARVDPARFRRTLSNLIDNAVESLGHSGGRVRIRLQSDRDRISIEVADNGRGISPEVLPQLGQRGMTFGKNGSGLGLYSAKKALREWDGSLSIHSQVGHGTTVTMSLPRSSAPRWFVAEISIPVNTPVVILDDDPSIHHIWRRRFDAVRATTGSPWLTAHHFSSIAELREWYRRKVPAQAIYLLDHELRGEATTGLELARELAIEDQVVLVTSHFGETSFMEKVRNAQIRLIPKNLAGFAPIRVESS